jgi:zinc protease
MHGARLFFAALFVVIGVSEDTRGATARPSYAVVVKKSTAENAEWQRVVDALKTKHGAVVIPYDSSVDESLESLRQTFPRFTCFVATPTEATGEFVRQVHQLARKLDDDPYADTFWGILTGYDAENALSIAKHDEPLVVKKVASGTEFATEMVTEGQWYDELIKNKHVVKEPGGVAVQMKGPDDTTQPLVDLLNEYQADLMITSGHATQSDWQIGFRYRNGRFRSHGGHMYGFDMNRRRIEVHSPNPKVYLPIGNCLMGDINGTDAMALAWMNDVGVKQMLGYTKPTWFGYMGWGVLDYFVEQPGRYTLTEAFFANSHALIHRLNDPSTPKADIRGLEFDRDVVAFYGDPKWSAKMAEMPTYYDQTLKIDGDTYTLTIIPNRGEQSFLPVNTNGSQRGWRPIIQFLPHRIRNVEILDGADLDPVVSDDFVLIPNPRTCQPSQDYVVRFRAMRREGLEAKE